MELYRSEVSPQFKENFLVKMGLSEAEFDLLLSKFRREYVPKKFFYLKAGQVSAQKAYVNKGSTRTYTLDEKGREHILFFAFEDWWVADFQSYYTGEPATQYIQATEDCELLCISKKDFDELEERIPALKEAFARKKQNMVIATMQRLNEVKSLTAEQRYLALIEKHPHIFQRIPLQYIASYLDIEPPSLSRLRKRLSER